jgi:hypothetical protein
MAPGLILDAWSCAALNRYGVVRFWRAPTAPLRVVITGSTKGIGKALAREFLRYVGWLSSQHSPFRLLIVN